MSCIPSHTSKFESLQGIPPYVIHPSYICVLHSHHISPSTFHHGALERLCFDPSSLILITPTLLSSHRLSQHSIYSTQGLSSHQLFPSSHCVLSHQLFPQATVSHHNNSSLKPPYLITPTLFHLRTLITPTLPLKPLCLTTPNHPSSHHISSHQLLPQANDNSRAENKLVITFHQFLIANNLPQGYQRIPSPANKFTARASKIPLPGCLESRSLSRVAVPQRNLSS
jgi:hypothetical protein